MTIHPMHDKSSLWNFFIRSKIKLTFLYYFESPHYGNKLQICHPSYLIGMALYNIKQHRFLLYFESALINRYVAL